MFREPAQAGFSLTEVIVASALLAMAVPLLVNLLPTSFLSLRKAQNLQAATSMALYRIDEVAFLRPRSGVDLRESIQVGEQKFVVTREFYQIDAQRWDVVVACDSENLAPVRLATRVIRETP